MRRSIRKKTLLKIIKRKHCYGNCVINKKGTACPLFSKSCCSTVTKRVNNMNFVSPDLYQAAIKLYLKHHDQESLFGVIL